MSAPTVHDAVVVGARCAGAGTALQLARGGASVVVLDRAPSLRDTLSTHALLRAGTLQLVRWGVVGDVIAAGTPPVHRTTFHLADGDIPITIKPAGGVDAFYAPRRAVLDRILVEAAAAAGADVRLGCRVVGLVHRAGRVAGVRYVDDRGRTTEVRADIVVGADGRASTVAAAVGAPVERAARSASAITYGYAGGLDVDGYRWWFRGGRSAGTIPTNFGEVCVFAGEAPGEAPDGEAPIDALRRGLARTAPEIADEVGPLRGVRSFGGVAGYLRRPWGDGWALVGDAGYFKDPITAHGMSDALRDAELLARAILAAEGDRRRQARELATYHRLRDRLSLPQFDVSDELAGHRWRDGEVRDLLLRLSASMADEVDVLLALDGAEAIASTA